MAAQISYFEPPIGKPGYPLTIHLTGAEPDEQALRLHLGAMAVPFDLETSIPHATHGQIVYVPALPIQSWSENLLLETTYGVSQAFLEVDTT